MKELIDQIIEIDNKTKILVSNTEEEIARQREVLRDNIAKLEKESSERAKKEAQQEFDKIIADAESIIEDRKASNLKELERIEKNYLDKKDKLIEDVFKDIILDVDDDWWF